LTGFTERYSGHSSSAATDAGFGRPVASKPERRRILHFAEDADTSGLFAALARLHDAERFAMHFGTLGRIDDRLREVMSSNGVGVVSLDAGSRARFPRALGRLARYLRRERIEILHTHLFEPSVIGLQAGALARTPVRVMTRHYSDYHTRIEKSWHVRLDRLCTRLCDDVIAVSEHTAEHLREVEGAPPGKVHVVLNGFDTSRVQVPDREEIQELRREFGALDAHLLVVVGRLHPEKGYEHLFAALPALRERVEKPLVLLVAGTGELLDSYRHQVAELGVEREVRFLGFRDDATSLMAAADLVVLPSVAEAFGITLAEALYVGTPVVATTAGGIPEIVDDGVDGVLVPPADSAALADAIAGLLGDPERLERMAGAGREKVVRRFSFESMVRAYETIYEARLREKSL
jgi:glycosyltransferase involved in cell wall biosynthesis